MEKEIEAIPESIFRFWEQKDSIFRFWEQNDMNKRPFLCMDMHFFFMNYQEPATKLSNVALGAYAYLAMHMEFATKSICIWTCVLCIWIWPSELGHAYAQQQDF